MAKTFRRMAKSPKTTFAAILGAVSALVSAIAMEIDGDPETTGNWALVIPLVVTALGLLFARDEDNDA